MKKVVIQIYTVNELSEKSLNEAYLERCFVMGLEKDEYSVREFVIDMNFNEQYFFKNGKIYSPKIYK